MARAARATRTQKSLKEPEGSVAGPWALAAKCAIRSISKWPRFERREDDWESDKSDSDEDVQPSDVGTARKRKVGRSSLLRPRNRPDRVYMNVCKPCKPMAAPQAAATPKQQLAAGDGAHATPNSLAKKRAKKGPADLHELQLFGERSWRMAAPHAATGGAHGSA